MNRRLVLLLVVLVGAAAVTFMVAKPGLGMHRLELRAYFRDAHNLHTGAPVRIAGIEVGKVTAVRVRSEKKESAAEIEISLQTSYPLPVPSDARARVETAGLLGGSYLDIDLSATRGAPLRDGDTIQVKEPTEDPLSLEHLIQTLAEPARHFSCTADREMKHLNCTRVSDPASADQR